MSLTRSRTAIVAADVVCHYCRKPGNGSSPYRVLAREPYPSGTRLLVCSPTCPELEPDARVFTVHTRSA